MEALRVGQIQFGNGGSGTLNLNDPLGTVSTSGFAQPAGGTGTLNLNGSVIQATVNSTTFLQGLTTANVRNGGAHFDSNGYTITVAQPLVHSTIAGDNSIDGGLTKIGPGTLLLTGANTYTGTTLISQGALEIGNGGTTGTLGSGAVVDNASLIFNRSDNLTIANGISGGGGITKLGAGSLTLSGAGSWTGSTTVGAGTLAIPSGNIGVNGSTASFSVDGAAAGAPLATLSGTGAVRANEVAIGASATGTFTQSGGTMTVGDLLAVGNAAGSTGNYNLSAGTVGTKNLYVGNSGTGTFTQTGGGVTASGFLVVGTTGTALGTWNQSGAASTVSTDILYVGNVGKGTFNLGAGSVSANTFVVGLSAGTGTFAQTGGSATTNGNDLEVGADGGTGTYTISGASSTLAAGTIAVGNAGAGTFNLDGGTVTASNLASGGSEATGTLNLNGGTLRASATNADFINVPVTNIRNGGAKIDTNGFNLTIGAYQTLAHSAISGDSAIDGGLTKLGAGNLILTGSNTYTGNTTVSAGTLYVQSGNVGVAGSTATVTVSGAAGGAPTLTVFNTGSLNAGTVYVGNGGTGLFNLDGGTATVGSVAMGANSTGMFDLNGGTLRPRASNATFFQGLTAANVRNGGAKIDTNGFDVTIAQPLLHSTVSGDNAADGGLTKTGAGTLTLSGSGANTQTGDTTVNGGTLLLARGGQGAANNFGSAMGGNLVVNSGGTARYGASSQVPDTRAIIANAGGLVDLNGFAESITLLGVFGGRVTTGTGYVNVRSGGVLADGSSTSSYAGNLHLEAATAGGQGVVSVDAGGNFTISGVVGNGDNGLATQLTKTGTGTLTLTNVNTFTGGTSVSAGTLAIPSGRVGVTSAPALFTVNGTGAAVALSGTGSLSTGAFYIGTGAVNQTGGSATTNGNQLYVGVGSGNTGVWNLGGASSTLSTGDIIVGNAGGAGAFTQTGGAVTIGSGKNLFLGLDTASSSTWNLSGGSLSANTIWAGYNGTGSGGHGNGTFTQTGGSVTTNGSNLYFGSGVTATGTYNLSGANATLSGGSIYLGNGGGAGTFNLDGGTVTAASIATPNDSTGTLNLNGGTLRPAASTTAFSQGIPVLNVRNGGAKIDTNGFDITVAQPLTHSNVNGDNATDGGLTKLGAGTLTLSGANTYTGATTINAGTLFAANTSGSATGTGAVVINNGGTLAGSGTIGGPVTVANGGTLLLGTPLSATRLTLGGNLALNASSTLGISLGGTAAGAYSQLQLNGALTLNGNLSVTEVTGFTLAVGQSFVIVDDASNNATVNGLFANAPGGFYTDATGDVFQVNYLANADGGALANDVMLTVQSVVPEPSTGAMALAGAALLGLVLRIRRPRLP